MLSIACRNVEQRFGTKVVPEEIPIDDEAAFKLMQSGNMDGLFQVEGALYVSLFARLPPTRFSDIVASIALNRPGPLESGMVDDYVKVASGKTARYTTTTTVCAPSWRRRTAPWSTKSRSCRSPWP